MSNIFVFFKQDITPSPLAMLAQTCIKIGSEPSDAHNEAGKSATTVVASSSPPTPHLTQMQTATSTAASVLPNVTLLPQMQSITIGGQEALFIPAQNVIDSSNAILGGGQSAKPIQLSEATAIPIQPINQSSPVIVQSNGQAIQQVPSFIQIPVSTAGGQTVYQTIQIGTVPLPLSNPAPIQLPQTGITAGTTSTDKGIIAEALASSEVQLKPLKRNHQQLQQQIQVQQAQFQSQQQQSSNQQQIMVGESVPTDVAIQASQLVHTSNGVVLMPISASVESAANKPITILAPSDKSPDFTTLVSVAPVDTQPQPATVQIANNQVREYDYQ